MKARSLLTILFAGLLFFAACQDQAAEQGDSTPPSLPQVSPEEPEKALTGTLQDLSWMLGTWRQAESGAVYSDEIWTKASSSRFEGNAFTIQRRDTIWRESLSIVVEDSNVVYYADVPENDGPVGFTLTDIGPQTATFENPTHDFPWKIAYTLSGDSLHARIAGFKNGEAAVNDLYLMRVR